MTTIGGGAHGNSSNNPIRAEPGVLRHRATAHWRVTDEALLGRPWRSKHPPRCESRRFHPCDDVRAELFHCLAIFPDGLQPHMARIAVDLLDPSPSAATRHRQLSQPVDLLVGLDAAVCLS